MILVTGATGLLGNCCVRELVARGEPVRVLVRAGKKRRELDGLNIEIVEGELDEEAAIDRAVAGTRAVIHSAALIHIGWTRLEEARRVNVEGTRKIVEACRRHGSRLVHVSTVDTLPAAIDCSLPIDETASGLPKVECTYVISKRESEQVVSDAVQLGLDAVIIHPGFMLAPYDWKPSSGQMFLGLARMPAAVAPSGSASVCDARDAAKAIANSIAHGRRGEHYILGGENIRYTELWTRMLNAMGLKTKVYRMRGVIPFFVGVMDRVRRVTGRPEGTVNGAVIAMGRLHHAYDSGKAVRELGYDRRPLDDTLREAWEWIERVHVKKVVG